MGAIPAAKLTSGNLLDALDPHSWVYFLCNVGDGDSQVILLPEDSNGVRRAMVVDAYTNKATNLITHLTDVALLPGGQAKDLPLVVATHPHQDHISNMPHLFRKHGPRIAEFWDPGYYHPINAYTSLMQEVEGLGSDLVYAQPSAGLKRWIGGSLITVLSPAVGLRNRFDTYGTEINDSSISLRIENPAMRAMTRDANGRLVEAGGSRSSLVLGGDAQTHSWAHVMVDFPYLPASSTEAARAIAAATGTKDLLKTDVLKVSHHGSKRGVNLELMERFSAILILVSSKAPGKGHHNFPHALTTEIIREVKEPRATQSTAAPRKPDFENGVYYTHDHVEKANPADPDDPLGTIGIVFRGGTRQIWRFGDDLKDAIDVTRARRVV